MLSFPLLQDCWVSLFGKVLDLTPLLADPQYGTLADPIVAAAGSDVSFWFDKKTGSVKTYVDPATNLVSPYCPQGLFIHVAVPAPRTGGPESPATAWWESQQYVVGTLSSKPRKLRIINSLTGHDHIIEVGGELTVEQIQHKYVQYNAHAGSYAWKSLVSGEFRPLDLHKTLEENGVPDDAAELDKLGLDADSPELMTTLLLSFADDLTVA